MLKILFLALSVGSCISAQAQIGGKNSFEFLNVPSNARLSALGGVNVSLADRDVNFFLSNPSLAGDSLAGVASASYQFYVADIGFGTVTYAHRFRGIGTLFFALQHFDYGSIEGFDDSGMPTHEFSAGETAMVVGKSHHVGNFRLGVNLKLAFSNLDGYRANALAVDIGGIFIQPGKLFTAGIVLKNMGFTWDNYSTTESTELPFDAQAGVTFKPEHMPLRFSVTAFNLNKADATYYDARLGGNKPGSFARVLSHVNFAFEILLHRHVSLMAGYNYFLHQALKLENGGAGAGISVGLAASIKSFDLAISRAGYVAGSAGYTFTLSKNIEKLFKR